MGLGVPSCKETHREMKTEPHRATKGPQNSSFNLARTHTDIHRIYVYIYIHTCECVCIYNGKEAQQAKLLTISNTSIQKAITAREAQKMQTIEEKHVLTSSSTQEAHLPGKTIP